MKETSNGVRLTTPNILVLITIVGAISVGIWGMSAAFGEKATKETVLQVERAANDAVVRIEKKHEDDVQNLRMGIWKLRSEQRIIIDAVAPRKARLLEPIPAEPTLSGN